MPAILAIQVAKLWPKLGGFESNPGKENTRSLFQKSLTCASVGKGVLDFVPLSEEYYEDIRRVRINPSAEKAMDVFKESFPVPFERIPSRVRDSEKEFYYESEKDPSEG